MLYQLLVMNASALGSGSAFAAITYTLYCFTSLSICFCIFGHYAKLLMALFIRPILECPSWKSFNILFCNSSGITTLSAYNDKPSNAEKCFGPALCSPTLFFVLLSNSNSFLHRLWTYPFPDFDLISSSVTGKSHATLHKMLFSSIPSFNNAITVSSKGSI